MILLTITTALRLQQSQKSIGWQGTGLCGTRGTVLVSALEPRSAPLPIYSIVRPDLESDPIATGAAQRLHRRPGGTRTGSVLDMPQNCGGLSGRDAALAIFF